MTHRVLTPEQLRADVMRLFDIGEAEPAPGYRYEVPIAPEDFL